MDFGVIKASVVLEPIKSLQLLWTFYTFHMVCAHNMMLLQRKHNFYWALKGATM